MRPRVAYQLRTGYTGADERFADERSTMDPLLLQELQTRLLNWLTQGYQVLADDVDGELRVTVLYVSPGTGVGSERVQEYWPMSAETAKLLNDHGIVISRALAGPRPWPGVHPEDI